MNIWLLVRLGWVIPLILLALFIFFCFIVIFFIDWFIDFEILKTASSKTDKEKNEHRLNLIKLLEIKANLIQIKITLRKLFK